MLTLRHVLTTRTHLLVAELDYVHAELVGDIDILQAGAGVAHHDVDAALGLDGADRIDHLVLGWLVGVHCGWEMGGGGGDKEES